MLVPAARIEVFDEIVHDNDDDYYPVSLGNDHGRQLAAC